MTKSDAIESVCVTDENYAPHFATLLKSIEANKGPETIRVHAILDGVLPETLKSVRASTPKLEIICYQVADHRALTLPPLLQISRATYLRLIMDEVLDPAYQRVLYLDIDMVVTGSLAALWRTDLAGMAVAAVADPGVGAKEFAATYDLAGEGAYLNAGMLLVDMEKARKDGLFSSALEHLLAGERRFEFGDQDALNMVLWQRWVALDPMWNFQRKFLYDAFDYGSAQSPSDLPKIIHFTETAKPWQSDEWHPHAWLYWKYLKRTPFFRSVASGGQVGLLRRLKFRLKYMWKVRLVV